MPSLTIDRVISLLLAAALVSLIARRLKLPYTVGLLLAGIVLALLHLGSGDFLTRDFIYKAILPPLIFEASLNTPWREFRQNARPVVVLATLGVLCASAIVACGMHWIVGWGWSSSVLLGVLLSATDPVAVISVFNDAGVSGRFRQIMEAESLLNDGTAATLFTASVAAFPIDAASHFSPLHTAAALAGNVAGGIGVGILVGLCAVLIARGTNDHLVETTITAVAAYGSFLVADHFGASGILATVTAGMLMGNILSLSHSKVEWLTPRGREVVLAFWEFAAFVANSIVFLIIGARAEHILVQSIIVWPIIAAIALVLIGRAGAVYPIAALFRHTKHRLTPGEQHLLFWGGLRGALALSLALSLPAWHAQTDQIVITTFGVVTFSLIVQGLTLPRLVKSLQRHIGKATI